VSTTPTPTTQTTTVPESAELDVFAVIHILLSARRLILGGPLVVGILTLGVTFLITPTFTASTTLIPPAQQSSTLSVLAGQLGALGGLAGAAGSIKNPVDQYVSLLKSRNVANAIIEKFKLKDVYEQEMMQDTRKVLSAKVRVVAGKKDGLLTVEVDDHDPKRAADMANAFVDELRRVNTEFAVGEASQRRMFFENQLKEARLALEDSEEELNSSGVSAGVMNAKPEAAVAGVARLKAMVTAQEVKIASMRGFVAPDNPDLRQAQTELNALITQLTRVEVGSPDARASKYTEKYRNFKYNELLFELIAKQYGLARLDEAREGALIQVIDPAIVPERKSAPKKAIITIIATFLVFLILSIFVLAQKLWLSRAVRQF